VAEREWLALLDDCAAALERSGARGWLVGGCLRDVLLGRAAPDPGSVAVDVDVVVTGDPLALARVLAPRGVPALSVARLGPGHGTVRVVRAGTPAQGGWQLDIGALRGPTIEADLLARDFTINALALPLAARALLGGWLERGGPVAEADSAQVVDPSGGRRDAHQRVLRAASATALVDDPLRVVRGARLAGALDLALDARTVARARVAATALGGVARERVGSELRALLALPALPAAVRAVAHLATLGAQPVVLPELGSSATPDSTTGSFAHARQTLATLESAPEAIVRRAPAGTAEWLRAELDVWLAQPLASGRTRALALRWAALLHGLDEPSETSTGMASAAELAGRASQDLAAPAIVAVCRRLGLAPRERDLVRAVARGQRPARALVAGGEGSEGGTGSALDELAARRWFARAGTAGVETLVVAVACARASVRAGTAAHGSADALARRAARLLAVFFAARERVLPAPLVDGDLLMRELGLRAGPDLGRVLAGVRAAQIEGAVATREAALRLARTLSGQAAGSGDV
jgi:tRNA nucleotidyltransferase/poly(A) polymerase